MDLATFSFQTANTEEAVFCRIHTAPVLIFAPPRPESTHSARELEDTGQFSLRPITPPKPIPVFHSQAQSTFTAESNITFLEKTLANPFAGMITLGRAPNNDIVMKDESISKIHAILTLPKEGAPWRISDRGSTNGTVLDGYELETDCNRDLTDGAVIAFGPRIRAVFFMPPGFFAFISMFRQGHI